MSSPLKMTSRHFPLALDGRTQAASVMAVVRSSEGASFTVTRALVPLKASAPPFLPPVVHVAVPIGPALPFPEASPAVVPVPSLNEYAATRPPLGGPAAWVVAVATDE